MAKREENNIDLFPHENVQNDKNATITYRIYSTKTKKIDQMSTTQFEMALKPIERGIAYPARGKIYRIVGVRFREAALCDSVTLEGVLLAFGCKTFSRGRCSLVGGDNPSK